MFVISQQSSVSKTRWRRMAVGLLLCVIATDFPAARGADTNTAPAYIVRAFDSGDGLPQNSIISMIQTRDGYLWLGTINGLVRFDGIRFTVFDEENTPGLNNSPIICLFEDSHGNLWIGTQTAGTVIMKNGRIIVPGKGELSVEGIDRRLLGACEDDVGDVWLYNANGDLWRYHGQQLRRFVVAPREFGPPRSIIKETKGPVWVATLRGQYAIGPVPDGNSLAPPFSGNVPGGPLDILVPGQLSGYWRLANVEIERWITNGIERDFGKYPWSDRGRAVGAACEDRDGSLVVGTIGAGLFRIGRDGQVTTNEGLSNNTILSLLVDREGTLWVGTDGGGLNRLKPRRFNSVEEIQSWSVQSVCEDGQGGLWIGSHGSGLGYWTNGTLRRFGGEYVNTVFVDRAGRLWAGVSSGLVQSQGGQFPAVSGNGLIQSEVQAIHQDRHGTLWFGTRGGLVSWNEREWKRYTTQEGLTSDIITAIADDEGGNLWIGTRRGGINRLSDGRFTSFRKADGLPSDDISSLLVDGQGVLWVGTFSSGLARFHSGRWTRYTTRDGLISKYLGYLVEDGDGNLWIGSNAGVLRIPKQSLNDFANGLKKSISCRAYGTGDGLPTFECTTGSQPGAWRGHDGKLWLPTIKGLVSVDPRQLVPNTNPPPVTIESVLIDDQPVTAGGGAHLERTVTIRPGQEHLEIQFSSLNLSAPERARFRYRLEGYQKDWTEERNIRAAHYRKLGPGHYNFHVTACNEDEVWNETGSTLAVIVQTPFWKTWWFSTGTAVCVFALIAGIVRYLSTQKLLRQVAILKQQEALEKERARIARDIHDQVGASLTQVALLGEMLGSDKDSPAEVEAHAQQISQTARETTRALDEIVWTVNPQNDTLDGLVNYICKYAQDYLAVAGVSYRFDIPAQLPAQPIAPDVRHNVFLASKEAVTNIVRHAKASAAWIRLSLEPTSFTLEIEDNGRGLAGLDQEAAARRNGLKNMRKRMEDIGGSFSIKPGSEGGALVCFTVPLKSE